MDKYYLIWFIDITDGVFDHSFALFTINDKNPSYSADRFEPTECIEITKEGAELFGQWCEDNSCGYDLCNGRAKGLARDYNKYEIYQHITTNYKA